MRGELRIAPAQQLRARRNPLGDLAERDRRAALRLCPAPHHGAVDDVQLGGRRLQQLGGEFDRLVAHHRRGDMHRAAGEHGRARRMRADAVVDQVGLAVDHAHALVVDAERLGANLRHRRLEALPQRRAAGDQFHRAVGIDLDLGVVARAAAALLHEDRDAGADQFARGAAAFHVGLQLVPAEGLERLFQQRRIVAGIEFELLDARLVEGDDVGQLLRGDQVAAAHLDADRGRASPPTASIRRERTNVLS